MMRVILPSSVNSFPHREQISFIVGKPPLAEYNVR